MARQDYEGRTPRDLPRERRLDYFDNTGDYTRKTYDRGIAYLQRDRTPNIHDTNIRPSIPYPQQEHSYNYPYKEQMRYPIELHLNEMYPHPHYPHHPPYINQEHNASTQYTDYGGYSQSASVDLSNVKIKVSTSTLSPERSSNDLVFLKQRLKVLVDPAEEQREMTKRAHELAPPVVVLSGKSQTTFNNSNNGTAKVDDDGSDFLSFKEHGKGASTKNRASILDIKAPSYGTQHKLAAITHTINEKDTINKEDILNDDDDAEGHYKIVFGTYMGDEEANTQKQYLIEGLFGEGTFGKVAKCYDSLEKKNSAIKIIKNIKKYRESAVIEIDILKSLQNSSSEDKKYIVALKDCFEFKNHVCMVFEALGVSLFDFLRDSDYAPFSLHDIKEIGRQLMVGIRFMHSEQYTHTDLKLENIMLVSPEYKETIVYDERTRTNRKSRVPSQLRIKIIDLGSATHVDQHHTLVVSTRHYRAIEVVLNLGWSFPIDMWSIACIFFELYTGRVLFQTHDNKEHLAIMEQILGPIPQEMILSTEMKKYFTLVYGDAAQAHNHHHQNHHYATNKAFVTNERYVLAWPDAETTEESHTFVTKKTLPLDHYAFCTPENSKDTGKIREHKSFFHLIKRLLTYLPSERYNAATALKHPFFMGPTSPSIQQSKQLPPKKR